MADTRVSTHSRGSTSRRHAAGATTSRRSKATVKDTDRVKTTGKKVAPRTERAATTTRRGTRR